MMRNSRGDWLWSLVRYWRRARWLALSIGLGVVVSACNVPPVGKEEKKAAAKQAGVPQNEKVPPALTNRAGWRVSASTHEGNFTPELAADGVMTTRWSSAWSDHQWWMVDFGRTEKVGRVTLHWEDAYAAAYGILVSEDGQTWRKVYETEQGDGGIDEVTFDPQPVRYVKIDLRRRATRWGFSLYEVGFNQEAKPHTEVSASSGTGAFAPVKAIDGRMDTRWSSDFSDDQWWQVKFDKVRTLGGVEIKWETAFGEKYEILVSRDGRQWECARRVEDGDGKTDILFFRPRPVRYLKLRGIQRGTGWGYSIWEMHFFAGDDIPRVSVSGEKTGFPGDNAIDGDAADCWHSRDDGAQWLELRLPKETAVGGVVITWGRDHAVKYALEVQGGTAQTQAWQTVYRTERGNGGRDYIYFPARRVKALRVRCLESVAGEGYAICGLELKGADEAATPLREYKAAAAEAPRGWYPMWLRREQEFWTITGVAGDSEETLVGETGVVEPYKGGFSVLPVMLVSNAVVTWADVDREQSLEEGFLPLPTVRWKGSGWNLEVTALGCGAAGEAATLVRYAVERTGSGPFEGRLLLAVRPVQVNPAWQHGGMSPIRTAACRENGETQSVVVINGEERIISLARPDSWGAVVLDQGDVIPFWRGGDGPGSLVATDGLGRVSVGLCYDINLVTNRRFEALLAFPLHAGGVRLPEQAGSRPLAAFSKEYSGRRDWWRKVVGRAEISIPERRLIDILRSNLAYILLNQDGPWIKPGPRNYNHAWIRDGAMTCAALLRMGLVSPVRAYVYAYTPLVAESGWVPYIVMEGGNPVGFNADLERGEGHEYDSQGEFPFLVKTYYEYTADTNLLRKAYPRVVAALRFVQRLRRLRKTADYRSDPVKRAYYGLLPASNSHEGYYPAQHSYWDDFWALRGLKDGAWLAERLGRVEDARWMRSEAEDLRRCLVASLQAVIHRNGLDYIPGCVEKGDFDPTSTAIAVMACDEAGGLPEPYLRHTFDRFFEDFRRAAEHGRRTYTPYEVRSAEAFVRMGMRKRALYMLRFFARDAVRPQGWNEMAEVVHARERAPSYIGDMPHTWVGSGYISAVRSLFVYEDGDSLVVGAGIDPAWLKEGVEVKNLGTCFGGLSYAMRMGEGGIVFHAEGTAAPPAGFRLALTPEQAAYAVLVNGNQAPIMHGMVRFGKLPVTIKLTPPGDAGQAPSE